MKKMKHGGKVHKRMQVGGIAAPATSVRRPMARPGTMVRPGVPSGPSRPISPRGSGPNDGGPKTGVKPYDGKPANPRVTYGPSGQLPGTVGSAPISQQGASDLQGLDKLTAARGAPVAQPLPPRPSAAEGKPSPMGPRSVTPYDDTPTASVPAGMTKADYLTSLGQPILDRQTPTKDMGRASLTFRKGGAVKSKAMRGGGLARKGVGMALAKGGLARRAGGCAKRGVGRGKIM